MQSENQFERARLPLKPLETLSGIEGEYRLGHVAVEAGELATASAIAQAGDQLPRQETLGREMDKARADIEAAGPIAKKKFASHLVEDGIPTWLMDADAKKNPIEFVEKLYAKDERGEPVVPDETVLNILQWHNMNQQEREESLERTVFKEMRQRYTGRLEKAVQDGWLAGDVIDQDKLDALQNTPIHIHDGIAPNAGHFDDDTFGTAAALAHTGVPAIALRRADYSKKALEKTFTHEMNHIITGSNERHKHEVDFSDWDTKEYVSPYLSPEGAGYGVHRLHETDDVLDNRGLSLLNEAITEHFAQALQGKNVEKVHLLTGSYRNERRVLKALCEGGRERISPGLFINAMLEGSAKSASGTTETPHKHAARLQEALNTAFPDSSALKLVAGIQDYGLLGGMSSREASSVTKQLRKGQAVA